MDFIINFGLLRQISIFSLFFCHLISGTSIFGSIPQLLFGEVDLRKEILYKIHDFVKMKYIQNELEEFFVTANNKTFYLTTPIYYPSGKFHIGTAYTTVCKVSSKSVLKPSTCGTAPSKYLLIIETVRFNKFPRSFAKS